MNHDDLLRFKAALQTHRETLRRWLEDDPSRKTIHLGGAGEREIQTVLSELKEALKKIDVGEFGFCSECDGDVETERLEWDFTTSVCLSHYSPAQLTALENELEMTARIQKQLLPCCLPSLSGIDIAVQFLPANVVGGDYYDFFTFRNGRQGLAIADVMGKGLPASMLMSNLQGSLRILGPDYSNPDKLATRLNQLFRYNLKLIRFISIFLLSIDSNNNLIEYCNAGHHPPALLRADTGKIQWLMPTGPAIGLIPQPEYHSKKIEIRPNDLLLLYTDGLVEARNKHGEEFGEERLSDYLCNHMGESVINLVEGLKNQIREFAGNVDDDVSVIGVKFLQA